MTCLLTNNYQEMLLCEVGDAGTVVMALAVFWSIDIEVDALKSI